MSGGRDPSRNFKKINPAESKIRLIFGLAVFCREFEFSAKLRLSGKFSAKIQIILDNFNRHRTLFCNVSTFLEKGVRFLGFQGLIGLNVVDTEVRKEYHMHDKITPCHIVL